MQKNENLSVATLCNLDAPIMLTLKINKIDSFTFLLKHLKVNPVNCRNPHLCRKYNHYGQNKIININCAIVNPQINIPKLTIIRIHMIEFNNIKIVEGSNSLYATRNIISVKIQIEY